MCGCFAGRYIGRVLVRERRGTSRRKKGNMLGGGGGGDRGRQPRGMYVDDPKRDIDRRSKLSMSYAYL